MYLTVAGMQTEKDLLMYISKAGMEGKNQVEIISEECYQNGLIMENEHLSTSQITLNLTSIKI